MTKWSEFIERYLARRKITGARLSEITGINKSLISDWRTKDASPSTKNARLAALGLRAPIAEAFEAAGFIEPGDLAYSVTDRPTSDLSADELVTEIRARLEALEANRAAAKAETGDLNEAQVPAADEPSAGEVWQWGADDAPAERPADNRRDHA